MFVGLFVSILFYLTSASANDYSNFSSPDTCPALNWDKYTHHPLLLNWFNEPQLQLYYEPQDANNPNLRFSTSQNTTSSTIELAFHHAHSLMFYAHYKNVKDFFLKELDAKYWPEEIRLIYAGDQIKNLPGIGALFCRDYQTPNIMTLVVSANFLQNASTFARILTHELYHYVIHIKGIKLPHWLEEGLAIQFEDKSNVHGGVTSSPMMDYHSKRRPWSSLTKLGDSNSITREDVYSFYGHANLLIYYIEKNISKNLPRLFILEEYDEWEPYLLSLLRPKWNSFKAMFTDFQVAKYINKTDDFNVSTDDMDELSKYTVLPSHLKMFLVQANRTPIEFTPPPLSGFIPINTNIHIYENNSNFTVKWISIEKYGAFIVTDEFTHANSFPVVIRWK